MRETNNHSILFVYADASVQPTVTGLGVVIRNRDNRVMACEKKAAPAMTCNEAEYCALIFAFELALRHQPSVAHFYSDSRLVVEQINGAVSVHSPSLKRLNRQARELRDRFQMLTITHIPRERNQLADAMADEAINECGTSQRMEEADVRRRQL